MITMTDAAVSKVKHFLTEDENKGKTLRLLVEGGGCSGFQYGLVFDETQEGDTKLEFDGISVLVDENSRSFIKGAEIDFVDTMQESGFKINNPNAKSSCGCGNSFEV